MSTRVKTEPDADWPAPMSAHFRHQYQNLGTVTRSRAQNRATVRSDASNRRSRSCHSSAFARFAGLPMKSLLKNGMNKVNP
jgi:hypothetical protein